MTTTTVFVLAILINAFAVLSRSAIDAFSLADAEELLRKRDRIRSVLPQLEDLAEAFESYAFTFSLLAQVARIVVAIALWEFLAMWPAQRMWILVAALPPVILLTDTLMRPLAEAYPEHLTLRLIKLWRLTHQILWAPLAPFHVIYGAVGRALRPGVDEPTSEQAEDDIRAVVSLSEAKGHIHQHERDMIEAVLELGDLTAEDIMTPRTDMSAIAIDAGIDEALTTARESGHSRLPVYRENRDDIVGLLYVKDLLGRDAADDPQDLVQWIRDPLLIPASKPVADVLAELRRNRVHLAVVLDEYGGTAGIISLEDIIEEVFGEIEDEHDEIKEDEAHRVDDAILELDARLRVEEVNERFELNLPEGEHYESLGGLVTSMLGCIPNEGQQWHSDDAVYCITVLAANERRVERVRVERRDLAKAS